MAQDIYNEQELQQLESEIRSMGEPYASYAPDEKYFSGFSARVLHRISAERNAPVPESFISRMKATFFGSTLRTSIVGACAVGAIVAVIVTNNNTDAPMAMSPAPHVVLPQTSPEAPHVQVAEAPAKHEAPLQQKHSLPKQNAPEPAPQNIANENTERTPMQKGMPIEDMKSVDPADQAGDFASYDETLSTGSDDDPITYDKLSQSELEAVLKILESK